MIYFHHYKNMKFIYQSLNSSIIELYVAIDPPIIPNINIKFMLRFFIKDISLNVYL